MPELCQDWVAQGRALAEQRAAQRGTIEMHSLPERVWAVEESYWEDTYIRGVFFTKKDANKTCKMLSDADTASHKSHWCVMEYETGKVVD